MTHPDPGTLAAEPGARRVPALDAVRGLAVLAVIAFHLELAPARGGWVGVDVFFVLSGYLITSLLLAERDRTGTLVLSAFWTRRVRRLLPALLVALAGVAIVAAALGGAEAYPTLRNDGLASLFYVANWHFIISDQSYFATFSVSPLRHMWSLAIEEQFYLFWPLVFLVLIRFVPRRRAQVAILVAAIIAAVWWTRTLIADGADLSRIYYGSDTRLPTILAGCLAAIATRHLSFDSRRAQATTTAAAAVGAAFLVFVVVAVPETSRWLYTHGGFAFAALAAAAVTVAAARLAKGPIAKVGSARFLVRAGLLSYALYLWHWPVIVFLNDDRVDVPTPVLRLFQFSLAWLLAELSFKFVEQPIRTRQVRVPKVVPVSFAAVATVAVLFIVLLQPVPGTTPPTSGGGEEVAGPAEEAGVPQVLVLGDSQAWSASSNVPEDFPYGVRGVYQAACDVIGDRIFVGNRIDEVEPDCQRWPKRWQASAARDPDAVLVLLGLRQLFDFEADGERVVVGSSAWEEEYRASVARALGIIRAETDAPILWFDVPCYGWPQALTSGEEHDPKRIDTVNRVLREVLADDPNVEIVDYADRVCEGEDGTELRDGVRPDGAHLSEAAAFDLWDFLLPQITARVRQPGG